MAAKIVRWLLISLILSLGFGQLLRFEFFSVPIYLHDVLVVILISVLTLQGRTLKVQLGLKLILLGIILGWLRALTLFPFSTLLLPFLYTVRLLAYLLLYLLLRASRYHLPKSYFYLSGTVTLTIGLLQYFFLPDMRWAQYLGWDDHLNRLILPHYDPTYTGVMLGLFLLIIPIGSWYFGGLIIIAVLLTYSRSVWFSLLSTGLIFLKNKVALFALLFVFVVGVLALPRRAGVGNNLLRTFSIESRWNHDLSIVKELKWDLLIGRGLNTFTLSKSSDKGFPQHAAGPNNSYLYILGTTGVIGLLGWFLFLKEIYANSRSRSVLLYILVASFFNNVLFYPFVLLWLLLHETVMAPSES